MRRNSLAVPYLSLVMTFLSACCSPKLVGGQVETTVVVSRTLIDDVEGFPDALTGRLALHPYPREKDSSRHSCLLQDRMGVPCSDVSMSLDSRTPRYWELKRTSKWESASSSET